MTKELEPADKAARVLRLMSWLGLVSAAAVAIALIVPIVNGTARAHLVVFVVLCVLSGIQLFGLITARGLFRREEWSRWAASVYGFLYLFAFPVGTIAGVYILWQAGKGWKYPPAMNDERDMRRFR